METGSYRNSLVSLLDRESVPEGISRKSKVCQHQNEPIVPLALLFLSSLLCIRVDFVLTSLPASGRPEQRARNRSTVLTVELAYLGLSQSFGSWREVWVVIWPSTVPMLEEVSSVKSYYYLLPFTSPSSSSYFHISL